MNNLSPRLVNKLADIFPGAEHVFRLGLDRASDEVVWKFAQEQGFTLVSRDADFSEMSVLRGHPPKVIWIRRGNYSTSDIEMMLREHSTAILALENDPDTGVLSLL